MLQAPAEPIEAPDDERVALPDHRCGVGVAPGDRDRPEPVMAVDDDQPTLAEHLETARAAPAEHVVPHRGERADHTGVARERRGHDVLDAGDAVDLA